ncbi:putative translation initiation factor 3 subunit M [Paratrimastix pyriformis]|uniref:Translation initiation factor 3 subunit M n=1 Tax=Paratrimastix pyriformis TaxID=342808 RepID=A0ABQ8UG81_9EUKA|nr:putative translation initiation factor 3 subunit M [Paratrimastix pyriformis]
MEAHFPALITLAQGHHELTYAEISSACGVPESEIEDFCIAAIMKNILDAKLDQLRKIVVIKSPCALPQGAPITREHWTLLAEKLREWKENLQSLSAVCAKITHPAPASAPAPTSTA